MMATEVMTTVVLADNTQWSAMDVPGMVPAVLVQTTDLNVGVMGTPDQLRTMIRRISEALKNPVTSETVKEITHGR